MSTLRVVNRTRGAVVGSRVQVADRFWSRLRGFLGRPQPSPGEGLLLTPCDGVHMFGGFLCIKDAVSQPEVGEEPEDQQPPAKVLKTLCTCSPGIWSSNFPKGSGWEKIDVM